MQGAALPNIVYSISDGVDRVYVSGIRGHTDVTVIVTVRDANHSRATCYDVMDAVEAALNLSISEQDGYMVQKPIRVQAMPGPDEVIEGKLIRGLRYIYSFYVYDPNSEL